MMPEEKNAKNKIKKVSDGFPGRYWHKEGDKIQCDICPRFCRLNEGQRGLCFVRARQNNQMVLTTYGRSSGFCIDPIEKKPLNHFLPGVPILSFGTAGCNLTCKFCQNWDISKSRQFDKLQSKASPAVIANVALKTNSRAVAYTYNDPVIFMEYAVDTARACRELGIMNVAVTAGYICPDPRKEFFSYMDAANVDLKGFTETFYKTLCTARLESVLDTLKYLKHDTGVWIELTDLLIPGENDSPREIERMSKWIVKNLGSEVPIHFTAFHPDYKMLEKSRTPPSTLLMARKIALHEGIKYVYTGNIHHKQTASTWCHNCGELVIGRDWHQLLGWHIKVRGDGVASCKSCGEHIPGVFEKKPGNWGRKRVPIRIR